MIHLKALGIKFISVFIALFITVNFAVTFYETLLMSVLFTLIGYVLGDLIVLKYAGKFVAPIADAAFVWVAGLLIYQSYTYLVSVLSALIIAIVEWFFHDYVERRVLETTAGQGAG
ncbi:MAG: YndM family protein [Novibacillus thermophilus]|uniref:DUF2512 domain-containing protein n=1 Tax=Novibacillus thermophilus TaxID=1471761 RepID=A0A1U9K5T1_9BACL|nr:DUF2512 family protein [Novibacillus thermophilus]AQS55394.1 hypothetical protein B0W44_05940 [Novibacillus thermophilus]